MNIGIIVFAYNRSWHLKKVLDGLRKNKKVSKLYIFQDGLNCEEHRDEWERTQKVIENTDWCEVEYSLSSYNKGLAESIVDGINQVFKKMDAVVVLEDDCVPHPLFMEYMIGCLEKYQNEEQVFSINGSAWDAEVKPNGMDAHFIGRINSCGWATWKNRWQFYRQDYKLISKIRKDPKKSHQLDIWGQDLESHLLGNIYGTCNSWAVFWALACIDQGGMCPTPYYSLIDNIGFDGSGVHCKDTDSGLVVRKVSDMRPIVLPDSVGFSEGYADAYANYFKWTNPNIKLNSYNKVLLKWNELLRQGINTGMYFKKMNIRSIAIWGKGILCKGLIQEISESTEIKYIIESRPTSSNYESIPVIKPDDISDQIQAIIVIPVYDMVTIRQKIKKDMFIVGIDEILENLFKEHLRNN